MSKTIDTKSRGI